jgi:hypothetical protein
MFLLLTFYCFLNRQEQLHIDLFVFFSVFFSCFFLFLSGVVVVWKIKQGLLFKRDFSCSTISKFVFSSPAADLRMARRLHVIEIQLMAQRPYSSVIFDSTKEENLAEVQITASKNKSGNKKEIHYIPIAIETTSDNLAAICTLFIQLPCQKILLGSSLSTQPKHIAIFNSKQLPRISQQNF